MKLVMIINYLFKHISEDHIPFIHIRYKPIDEDNIYKSDFDLFLAKRKVLNQTKNV